MTLPHQFNDETLEQTAFTHRSFGRPNNERLEWLGDAVLEFEVSRLLYGRFEHISEGGLTLVRLRLVRGETLAALARHLGLAAQMRLGGAAMAERNNDNILAGAMEAYIAAIYLDGGDVGKFLAIWMEEDIATMAADIRDHGISALRDAKSQLQEIMQQRGLPPPDYAVINTKGASHRRTFLVECRAEEGVVAQASAPSMAQATQLAAEECLRRLRNIKSQMELQNDN